MKIDNKFVIAVVLIAVMLAAVAISQAGNDCNVPASKAAVAGEDVEVIQYSGEGSYGPVLLADAIIKTGNKKDLVMSFTSEMTLVTDTTVIGSGKDKEQLQDMDEDIASIVVWIEVDGDVDPYTGEPIPNSGVEAFPGPVVFAERVQYMEGRLSEITWVCNPWADLPIDPETGEPIPPSPDEINDCIWDLPEYVRLLLNTTSANGFNYLMLNMEPGCHDIRVWATVELQGEVVEGEKVPPGVEVAGIIGKRTLVVEEVRLINEKVTV